VRNCVDHLAAPPTYMHHHELKLDSNKASLTAEGHRLNNLPVPSMPWRPCSNLCFFFKLNINYRQINSTQCDCYTLRFVTVFHCVPDCILFVESWKGAPYINCWFFKFCISMSLFKGDPSKLKYQKRTHISKPTGLLVKCPENVLKIKEISTQKLWYELFAPWSYVVKRTDETLFANTWFAHQWKWIRSL